jgi:hypothetical protein
MLIEIRCLRLLSLVINEEVVVVVADCVSSSSLCRMIFLNRY